MTSPIGMVELAGRASSPDLVCLVLLTLKCQFYLTIAQVASKLVIGGTKIDDLKKGTPDMSEQQRAIPPHSDPSPLYHLGYVSTETSPFSQEQLLDLLNDARRVNDERNVTGLLLYREGSFYQVLEGEEAAVKDTFKGIEQDPRHTAVRVLFNGLTEAREFADWQMGFINLDNINIEKLIGFSDFLSRDAQPQEFLENLSRGKRLALMFRTLE